MIRGGYLLAVATALLMAAAVVVVSGRAAQGVTINTPGSPRATSDEENSSASSNNTVVSTPAATPPFATWTPTPLSLQPTPTLAVIAPPIVSVPETTTIVAGNYISREVIIAPIGSGPGQIGIKKIEGGLLGPQSIALDGEGNIYVLDTANHRVNRYDRQGVFLSATEYPEEVLGVDIALGADGSLYVLDGREFRALQYTANDNLVGGYEAPGGKPCQVYSIAETAEGALLMESLVCVIPYRFVFMLRTSDEEISGEERAILGNLYPYGGGTVGVGEFKRDAQGRTGTYELKTRDTNTTVLKVPVLLPSEIDGYIIRDSLITGDSTDDVMGGAVRLVGEDGAGHLYFMVTVQNGPYGRKEKWILKFTPQGKPLLAAPIPSELFDWTRRRSTVRVDREGNIYILAPFENQVRVIKWEKRPSPPPADIFKPR